MKRIDGRECDQLRPVEIVTDFVKFPEGSVLISCGNTKVLCCASVEEGTPRHVPEGTGWVTAEYSMLPRANRERSRRDVSKLKLSPRMRGDPAAHRPQPPGGGGPGGPGGADHHRWTATCSRGTAAPAPPPSPAAFLPWPSPAGNWWRAARRAKNPIRHYVAAVSAGIVGDVPMLDLCYEEDSRPWWTSTA